MPSSGLVALPVRPPNKLPSLARSLAASSCVRSISHTLTTTTISARGREAGERARTIEPLRSLARPLSDRPTDLLSLSRVRLFPSGRERAAAGFKAAAARCWSTRGPLTDRRTDGRTDAERAALQPPFVRSRARSLASLRRSVDFAGCCSGSHRLPSLHIGSFSFCKLGMDLTEAK